jgi:general stress protein 26
LITTSKSAKKTQNLRNKPVVYFSIDDENLPYQGVKGKGIANIIEDIDNVVPQAVELV